MQECFVPSLVEIGPVALEKIFKCRQCTFAVSLSISPLKRSKLYIWTNLISVHSRMIHKSIWNWSTGSGADDFFKWCQCTFCRFAFISPWKRTWFLIGTNLNSLDSRIIWSKIFFKLALKCFSFRRRWKCVIKLQKDGRRTTGDQEILYEVSAQWAKLVENRHIWGGFFAYRHLENISAATNL